mmetsp:Transcript_35681/g.57533  ORF Transcript_35681/g.57533 Transcript_35681/m.57533 type:complete len:126 (+) Transcript_35681:1-378(+)
MARLLIFRSSSRKKRDGWISASRQQQSQSCNTTTPTNTSTPIATVLPHPPATRPERHHTTQHYNAMQSPPTHIPTITFTPAQHSTATHPNRRPMTLEHRVTEVNIESRQIARLQQEDLHCAMAHK